MLVYPELRFVHSNAKAKASLLIYQIENFIKERVDVLFVGTIDGVKFEEQLEFFKDKYCDDIQGYYYSKPLNFSDLKKFIKEHYV